MTTSHPSRDVTNPFGNFRVKAVNSPSARTGERGTAGVRRPLNRANVRVFKSEVFETKGGETGTTFTFVVPKLDGLETPTFRPSDTFWSSVNHCVYEVKTYSPEFAPTSKSKLKTYKECANFASNIESNASWEARVLMKLREEIREIFEKTLAEALESIGRTLTPSAFPPSASGATQIDPLAAARARGVTYMKAQLDLPENVNLDAAAEYSGLSGRHVNELRQRGELYALVLEGNTRRFRYPRWQFDAESERLVPVLKNLQEKSLSCWAMHDFLTRSNDFLGRSPKDGILDPSFPLERVKQAVERRFGGTGQGAL